MAYQYDQLGNVIGEYESEEERRAREQKELNDTAVQTQEIKTYGDGTVEKVTKESLPPELQRQQAAYQQTVAQVAPVAQVSPDQAAYTRQQESGGRRDIGYHFPADAQGKRQSTAFGPYGITDAAYKDIVRQDPSLNKPITEWTQEEHDRGYNTLVGRNQARLTQLGIEPSAGALQLSHLLGPDGAARFLKTGQVSEAAAAANGGAERLKQIAQGRFANAPAASSGAAVRPPQAQPEEGVAVATGQGIQGTPSIVGPVSPEQVNQQAQQFAEQFKQYTPAPNSFDEFGTPMFSQAQADLDNNLNAYQAAQGNPEALFKVQGPDWLKQRSRNEAADLIIQQREDELAQKKAAELDENKIAKLMSDRKGEGSRLKGMVYAAFGLKDLANEELYKLGIGTDKVDTINNEPVIVKVAANGKAINGINVVTGKELTTREIAQYNADNPLATGGKGYKPEVSGTGYVKTDAEGNVIARGVRVTDTSGGKTKTYIESGGKKYNINSGWQPESISTATAKAEAGKKVSLAWDPIIKAATVNAEELTKENRKYGTNFAIVGYGAPGTPNAGKPILVDQNTGQIATPNAEGKVSVTQNVAPGGTSALETKADITKAQGLERSKSNEAYNEKLATNRETAQPQKATIDRLQTSIDKNPNFWGIDTNSPAWRAFVDLQSSNENKAEALNTLARNLNIPANKRAEFDQTMNDYRNLQVNAITGSGLSASQTNSEKESQRVVGVVGSISDKPAAAKATLEYAKAKIEYTDAKARAWATARRANPNVDRLDFDIEFDEKQGAKIFEDANKRMKDILAGVKTAPAGSQQTKTIDGKTYVFDGKGWKPL
jgi:hypothetical protein